MGCFDSVSQPDAFAWVLQQLAKQEFAPLKEHLQKAAANPMEAARVVAGAVKGAAKDAVKGAEFTANFGSASRQDVKAMAIKAGSLTIKRFKTPGKRSKEGNGEAVEAESKEVTESGDKGATGPGTKGFSMTAAKDRVMEMANDIDKARAYAVKLLGSLKSAVMESEILRIVSRFGSLILRPTNRTLIQFMLLIALFLMRYFTPQQRAALLKDAPPVEA